MKILDPQSAVLTNFEVHHFLSEHPSRRPSPAVGGYQGPDLQGLHTVVKEFQDYTTRIAPHLTRYPADADKWLPLLIRRLKPYKLTKAEVLMIVNLGIGVPAESSGTNQNGASAAEAGEGEPESIEQSVEDPDGAEAPADGEKLTEAQESDQALLTEVIEELEERLEAPQVVGILKAVEEVLGGNVEMERNEKGDEAEDIEVT